MTNKTEQKLEFETEKWCPMIRVTTCWTIGMEMEKGDFVLENEGQE